MVEAGLEVVIPGFPLPLVDDEFPLEVGEELGVLLLLRHAHNLEDLGRGEVQKSQPYLACGGMNPPRMQQPGCGALTATCKWPRRKWEEGTRHAHNSLGEAGGS